MIAAVAAIVAGGAFANCGRGTPGNPASCSVQDWVYTWKFSGKTTEGVKVKGSDATEDLCGRGTPAGDDVYVRVPASLKIQGYVAYCDVSCGSEMFEVIAAENEFFWQTKPEKIVLDGGLNLEVSNVIGKKKKQYEVAGTAEFTGYYTATDPVTYQLTLAGLGKYDKKNDRVSSASGNFAGTLVQFPWYVSNSVCKPAGAWTCCTFDFIDPQVVGALPSVAYGKWSVKYNKKLSKKLQGNNGLDAVVKATPKWARASF